MATAPIFDPAEPDDLTVDPALAVAAAPSAIEKLLKLAESEGDISSAWGEDAIIKLGQRVCEDYERDLRDRSDWQKVVERAQESAAQEKREAKTYPWANASNVRYPLLTVAALQFNARAYPAIVKGDEAISVKVVGSDKGRPQIGPDGQPMVIFQGQPMPQAQFAQMPVDPENPPEPPQPAWEIPPGAKTKRAQRVRGYLNTTLFYRIDDWERDTDALLMDLPIVGCAFRKVWYSPADRKQHAAFVPALRIVVPMSAKSIETTPRLTEEVPDVYPYQIRDRQRSGFYREAELQKEGEDEDASRKLLEQHRLIDLDGDGLDEPYVVTVDHASQKVLRIEANFSSRDVQVTQPEMGVDPITGQDVETKPARAMSIKRGKFYVKYDFFPHPQGKFYGIGLGHLLDQIGGVINSAINQINDAGTAQTAGGGFIAGGVRLQSHGRGSTLTYEPGKYKTVDGVSGAQLRDAFYERTFPGPSPITFQVLDLMLSAAKDISSIKDVITGDASNNGQVGTTLALIEQGLQVFTAIYKRCYRSLREEYQLLFENIAAYGGEEAANDYDAVLDDPAANFEQDFQADDMDIRPVSDPSSVTRMQQMARAQALLQISAQAPPGTYNLRAVHKRALEAMDTEDIDELLPEPQPQQPDPKTIASANKDQASAHLTSVNAQKGELELAAMTALAGGAGVDIGGGIPGVEGGPGNPMGVPGGQDVPRLAA